MKTIKHSLLLAAMTLLPVWTIAQEKTWEVISHGDESSLIREVPSGRWFVYNHNSGISYFSQVSSTGNVASMFQLGYNAGANYTIIHDFELFKDTVYFCGQTGTMEKRRSIWGYFPLTNFPQVDVYVREADFDNLKKLEVFTVDSTMKEVHVVMLGEKDEKETVVDEMRIAPNQFNESFSEIFSPGVQFNDIAVTDSHIVVIAETKPIIISTKIVFIERPSTVGMPIFNGNIRFRERSKLTTHAGNELLKTCDGYFCVHAYLDSRDGIVVTAYNGKSYHSSVNIPVNENRPPKLTSICYGKAFRNLEILTRPFLSVAPSSTASILHCPAMVGRCICTNIGLKSLLLWTGCPTTASM